MGMRELCAKRPSFRAIRGVLVVIGMALASGVTGCGAEDPAGCESGQVDCDGTCIPAIAATAASVHAEVIAKGCTFGSCHSGSAPRAGLDLTTIEKLTATVGKGSSQGKGPLVTAGDPAKSYLLLKMKGEDLASGTTQMPPSGKLCQAKIDALQAWITAGAPK